VKPCPTKSNCPCEGNPAGNFSSEAPDRDVFLGFSSGSPQITPPIGTPFDNANGYNFCESTVSQEAADLCAAAGAVANQVDDGNPSTPDDGAANDPGNWGVALYQNNEQSCTIQCPNGGQFTYVVPAGTVTNPNPTLVDRAAESLACNNANKFLICIGSLDNVTGTVGTSYFGTVILTGNFAPYHWTATTPLPAGLVLDDASGGDPTLSKTVGIIGTPTTSGAQSFTLRATDSQGNYAERTFTITVTGTTLTAYWSFDHALDPRPYPGDPSQKYFTDEVAGLKLAYGMGLQINGYFDGFFQWGSPGFAGVSVWDGKFPAPYQGRGNGAFQPLSFGFPTLTIAAPLAPGIESLTAAVVLTFGGGNWFTQVLGDGGDGWLSDPFTGPIGTFNANGGSSGPASLTTSAYDVSGYPVGIIGKGYKLPFGNDSGSPAVLSTDDITQISFNPSSPGLSCFGWFKFDGTTTTGSFGLFNATMGNSADIVFSLAYDRPTNTFTLTLTDPLAATTTATLVLAVSNSAWHFFAGTFDNVTKKLTLYIDAHAPVVSTAPNTIAAAQTHGSFAVTQAMPTAVVQTDLVAFLEVDEIGLATAKVYSAAQIATLYNGGAGKTWPAVNSI